MITVVCPVFNEEGYIKTVLDFFVQSLPIEKELLLVDGNSTDATCAIIRDYMLVHKNIQLLSNPNRYVPFALNKAITAAHGEVIVRLDAHTNYDIHYFEKVMETFEKSKADIVGGAMRIAPGNAIQNAIGYATTTRFGVGNSSFHFENFEGFTDSVYLGAWKKYIFEKTGLFDVNFKRNQDDEFHYRAKSMGFTVYQSPDIKLYYHPRKNLPLLFKQYYQYGLYKPLVLKKVKTATNLRHLVPSMFVLYLAGLVVCLFSGMYLPLFPLGLYALLAIVFTAKSKKPFHESLLIPVVYLTLHISYGSGFLAGIFKKTTLLPPEIMPAMQFTSKQTPANS